MDDTHHSMRQLNRMGSHMNPTSQLSCHNFTKLSIQAEIIYLLRLPKVDTESALKTIAKNVHLRIKRACSDTKLNVDNQSRHPRYELLYTPESKQSRMMEPKTLNRFKHNLACANDEVHDEFRCRL